MKSLDHAQTAESLNLGSDDTLMLTASVNVLMNRSQISPDSYQSILKCAALKVNAGFPVLLPTLVIY